MTCIRRFCRGKSPYRICPHGAGRIIISKAYYTHFIARGACPDRLIRMAQAMGKANARAPMDFIQMLDKLQRDCGGGELKMSDYGIRPEECRTLAQNTKDTMGGLFAAAPCSLTLEDGVNISY